MNKIYKAFNHNIILDGLPFNFGIIKLFYIKKYGTEQAAEKVFTDLKDQCLSDDEFNIKVEEKFEIDFNLKIMQPFYEIFLKKDSFSSILDMQNEVNELAIQSQLTIEEIDNIIKIRDTLISILKDNYKCDDAALRKVIIAKLADKITFTIKETREELGFKNQRTFKKWLDYFYPGKFENKRTINILDYIDIWKKFLLGPDENQIDLNKKAIEYKKRLNDGLIFSKKRLKNLTKTDYKLLKIEMETIIKDQNLQLPENVDFYPYSIAQVFKKFLT